MNNLIEYSDNYSKTSGSLWNYYRDEQVLHANGFLANFSADNIKSVPFKIFKTIASRTEMIISKC